MMSAGSRAGDGAHRSGARCGTQIVATLKIRSCTRARTGAVQRKGVMLRKAEAACAGQTLAAQAGAAELLHARRKAAHVPATEVASTTEVAAAAEVPPAEMPASKMPASKMPAAKMTSAKMHASPAKMHSSRRGRRVQRAQQAQ